MTCTSERWPFGFARYSNLAGWPLRAPFNFFSTMVTILGSSLNFGIGSAVETITAVRNVENQAIEITCLSSQKNGQRQQQALLSMRCSLLRWKFFYCSGGWYLRQIRINSILQESGSHMFGGRTHTSSCQSYSRWCRRYPFFLGIFSQKIGRRLRFLMRTENHQGCPIHRQMSELNISAIHNNKVNLKRRLPHR